MKKQEIPTVLAGLALGLLLQGCGQEQAVQSSAPPKPPVLELAPADVITVSASPLASGLPISGALQALHQTTVQARVPSEVLAVLVREGEAVKKGQLLARLGTQELEARVKQAQAQLASAKVEAQLTRGLVERNRRLYEKQYFSELDYQRSVAEAQARDEAVRAQESLLAIARKALNDAQVLAPMSGIVAKRYIEPGSAVGMDARLFEIVELSELELAAPVPAPEIPRVQLGQQADFSVDGFASQRFQGRVVRINPVADAGTRAITVYIQVRNPSLQLKGGMYARGSLNTGSSTPVLSIPQQALRQGTGEAPWIFVLSQGRLEKRSVELGARDEQAARVAVRQGLQAGEQVVVAQLAASVAKQPARISQ